MQAFLLLILVAQAKTATLTLLSDIEVQMDVMPDALDTSFVLSPSPEPEIGAAVQHDSVRSPTSLFWDVWTAPLSRNDLMLGSAGVDPQFVPAQTAPDSKEDDSPVVLNALAAIKTRPDGPTIFVVRSADGCTCALILLLAALFMMMCHRRQTAPILTEGVAVAQIQSKEPDEKKQENV